MLQDEFELNSAYERIARPKDLWIISTCIVGSLISLYAYSDGCDRAIWVLNFWKWFAIYSILFVLPAF